MLILKTSVAWHRRGDAQVCSCMFSTIWGGRLRKRFCNIFFESSTGSWAELQLPCCPSKQARGTSRKHDTKPFYSTCRPRLYIPKYFPRGNVIFCITHELSVAEEVDPLGVDGLAVLGPGEGGHGVALDRRRDPQLLTLVHRHVAQRTAEEKNEGFFTLGFCGNQMAIQSLYLLSSILAIQ